VVGYLAPFEEDTTEGNTTGQRMMELRLALAEGRISREQFWRGVDALPAQDRRSNGAAGDAEQPEGQSGGHPP
jgi:hypothetical protein